MTSRRSRNGQTTTGATAAVETLRGTGNWLAYITAGGRFWLPGGWEMIANRAAIVGTSAVAALAVAGLARRDLPQRTWLVLTSLAGAVAMGAGYGGGLHGVVAGPIRHLLDGPLVAFRNTNKVQPVLALPLALGVVHGLAVVQRAVTRHRSTTAASSGPSLVRRAQPALARGTLAVAGLAIVGAGLPLFHGRLPADGAFTAVPSYWHQTARWLDTHAHGERSLLLPGSAFAEYQWGRPLDEPLGSLTDQPWAVRDDVPLGSNGSTRLLDRVELELGRGSITPGLVQVLARSGVGFLVVRNDLDATRTASLSPAQVRRALTATPGLARVARFGPQEPSGLTPARLRPDLGAGTVDRSLADLRAVEIYRLAASAPPVTTYPVAGSLVVSGQAESLVPIADAGQLEGRGTVLTIDATAPGIQDRTPSSSLSWAVTDTARRRDVNFGVVQSSASYTLTSDQVSPDTGGAPVDRVTGRPEGHLAVAEVDGAATVRSSSYALNGIVRRAEAQPFAALDGDPGTAWQPGQGLRPKPANTVGQWLEVDLDRPRRLGRAEVSVPVGPGRSRVTEVRLTTDHGNVPARPGADGHVTVALPGGATGTLRITVVAVQPGSPDLVGPAIIDLSVPGLHVTRPVATAHDRPSGASTAEPPLVVLERQRADPFLLDASDEDASLDRIVAFDQPAELAVTGTVTARSGPAHQLVTTSVRPPSLATPAPSLATTGLSVTATSTWNGLPAFAAGRAFDGDTSTSWVASPDDPSPALVLRWPEPRVVDRARIVALGPPATGVHAATLTAADGETRTVPLSADQPVDFAPLRTDVVTIRTVSSAADPSVSRRPSGASPIGIAEVEVPALADLRPAPLDLSAPVALPCGRGPTITVDDQPVATSVAGTVGDLVDARAMVLHACGDGGVRVGPGRHRIRSVGQAGDATAVASLSLAPIGTKGAMAAPRRVDLRRWSDEHRSVDVGPGALSFLALSENANPGWEAHLDGRRLSPVRFDGWRQAWVVPAGRGGAVAVDYAPAQPFQAVLLLGLALVAGLVALACWPRRRTDTAVGGGVAAPLPGWTAPVVVAAVALLLGGVWLAVAAVAVAVLPRRGRLLPGVAAGAALAGGLVVFLAPGRATIDRAGSFSAVAQFCAVLALTAVAASLLPEGWTPSWRRRDQPKRAPARTAEGTTGGATADGTTDGTTADGGTSDVASA